MTPLKVTGFKLTDADLKLLEVAQEHYALPSRTEALRYVLRYWAQAEGVAMPKPKRRQKKR